VRWLLLLVAIVTPVQRNAELDFRQATAGALTRIIRPLRQWAEEELVIPEGRYVGQRWSAETQPFGALLFDLIDSHRWPRHVVTGCVQSGKSLHDYVAPTLYHLFEQGENVVNGIPTMDLAHDKWSKEILPAIRANVKYRALLPSKGPGSRQGVGNLEKVQFQNGMELKFMSAGGGDEKRSSYTSRVLVATELDKYDTAAGASREADPVSQMEARLASNDIFERRFYGECTVSVPEGRVWREYLAGTASKIMCPCPHCREFVCPEREHLAGWREAETELAAIRQSHFCCPACGHEISEDERRVMNLLAKVLHRGQSIDRRGRITGDPPETLTLGFRWNAFNNLFWTVGAIGWKEWQALRADDEDSAQRELDQFYWAVPHQPPELDLVHFRADAARKRFGQWPKGQFPPEAVHFTVGLDLGKRVGYWVAMAWLPDGRGHIVDYGTIEVPSDDLGEQRAILVALRDFRERVECGWNWPGHDPRVPDQVWIDARYQGETKGRRPSGVGVVYDFISESQGLHGQRYRPCLGFGASQLHGAVYSHPHKKEKTVKYLGEQYYLEWERDSGCHVCKINSDYWKVQLQERLSIPSLDAVGAPNAGAVTLYAGSTTEHVTYCKHIAAERPVKRFEKGVGETIGWERESRANHYFDASYLAVAAGHFCGVRIVRVARVPAIMSRHQPQAAGDPSRPRSLMPDGRPFLVSQRGPH